MAIDQRDVSSTLRFMDDRALQQYAVMHKNDPYIFPLAFQESQNRQKLRMGQQGAQGMPQPKVTDQALAQMSPQRAPQMSPQMGAQPMPEDQGIARLPVGNMDFAEGGIVAFSNGGDTEEATSPYERFLSRGAAKGQEYEESERLRNILQAQYGSYAGIGGVFRTQSPEQRAEAQRIASAIPRMSLAELKELEASGVLPAAPLSESAAAPAAQPAPRQDLRQGLTDPRVGIAGLTPEKARAEQAAAVEQQNMGPAPAPTRSGAPSMDVEGIMGLRRKETDRQLAAEAAAAKIQQDALAKDRIEQQADVESARTSYSDREERLKKREERMAGDKERNVGKSLFEAGLAMMAGRAPDGSTNLFSVLAAGAQQGLKGYQGRLEKINVSKEKLDDDFSSMYELRQAKVDAAGKELRNINKREADLKASALRNANTFMSALGNEEVNLKTKQFENFYNTWKTTYEQGQANERARITAAGGAGRVRPDGMTEYQYSQLVDRAVGAVDDRIAKDAQLKYSKDPGLRQRLINDEIARATGRMTPSATSTSANISRADQLVGISP